MATSATEEEFLQVLDEMNRICGAEEGGSASMSAEVSGLGFEVGIEDDDDDDEEERDKGSYLYDIHHNLTFINDPFPLFVSKFFIVLKFKGFLTPSSYIYIWTSYLLAPQDDGGLRDVV